VNDEFEEANHQNTEYEPWIIKFFLINLGLPKIIMVINSAPGAILKNVIVCICVKKQYSRYTPDDSIYLAGIVKHGVSSFLRH
jgi:hypothetical protein